LITNSIFFITEIITTSSGHLISLDDYPCTAGHGCEIKEGCKNNQWYITINEPQSYRSLIEEMKSDEHVRVFRCAHIYLVQYVRVSPTTALPAGGRTAQSTGSSAMADALELYRRTSPAMQRHTDRQLSAESAATA
jgi:hypothetical protein